MPTETHTDLQSFHEFVAEQLKNSDSAANLSPEQALTLWKEQRATIASARRGLDDLDAGRVKPANEVLERLGRDAH